MTPLADIHPLLYIVYALAAARVTHIITTDTVGNPIRRWAIRTHRYLDELVHCPWCIGFWVSLFATVVLLFNPFPIFNLVALSLAFSYITGFLESFLHTMTDHD